MDWEAAIETNREALKRILLALVAMAGLADGGRAPLPRILHRTVLRLLRPAESAARRLVIVAARGLTVTIPPMRPRAPAQKKASAFVRNGAGTGILIPPGYRFEGRTLVRLPARPKPARLSLPLFDTLRDPTRFRVQRVAPSAAPRISGFGFSYGLPVVAPARIGAGAPPGPNDPISTERLTLRLEALARALDDLPAAAQRFARWRDRRAAGMTADPKPGSPRRFCRVSALRPGRPPGSCRKSPHEVHGVLADLQGLALWALERPDTS